MSHSPRSGAWVLLGALGLGVLLVGIVIGWILGSRAAADAYAAQLKKMKGSTPNSQSPTPRERR